MSNITLEELQTSHDYWVANFNEKAKSIDKICVKSAERLGEIDWILWRPSKHDQSALYIEKRCLEDILRHFIGFVDLEYVVGHDLSPESIERNKTREDRL
jgi:hypothetical protein